MRLSVKAQIAAQMLDVARDMRVHEFLANYPAWQQADAPPKHWFTDSYLTQIQGEDDMHRRAYRLIILHRLRKTRCPGCENHDCPERTT